MTDRHRLASPPPPSGAGKNPAHAGVDEGALDLVLATEAELAARIGRAEAEAAAIVAGGRARAAAIADQVPRAIAAGIAELEARHEAELRIALEQVGAGGRAAAARFDDVDDRAVAMLARWAARRAGGFDERPPEVRPGAPADAPGPEVAR